MAGSVVFEEYGKLRLARKGHAAALNALARRWDLDRETMQRSLDRAGREDERNPLAPCEVAECDGSTAGRLCVVHAMSWRDFRSRR